MGEIILHQYARSPFSEKVRLAFGFKGLPWRSVEIPALAPKPDLTFNIRASSDRLSIG
jgi:glutathione S-transferase